MGKTIFEEEAFLFSFSSIPFRAFFLITRQIMYYWYANEPDYEWLGKRGDEGWEVERQPTILFLHAKKE